MALSSSPPMHRSAPPDCAACQVMERDTDDFLMYFILMEKVPVGKKTMEPGALCYMSEESYVQRVSDHLNPVLTLNVHFLQEEVGVMAEVDVNVLHPLMRKQAALLLPIANPIERLSCFLETGLLDQALKAEVGQRVLVEHEHKLYPAFIHYVGNFLDDSTLLPPIYFGVELEVSVHRGPYMAELVPPWDP